MKKLFLISVFLLAGCFSSTKEEGCNSATGCHQKTAESGTIKYFANEEDMISLQNLTTRVVVHCYTTEDMLAETCAQAFEKKNFVRFRDIPYRTANYDFLKKGTYPTRRWRSGEKTPRW